MQGSLHTLSAALPDTGVSPESLGARLGETVTLCGIIHKIRRMSGFAFVLLRTARQVIQCVYDPAQADFDLETLREEAAVRLNAEVAADPRSRQGWELRLRACSVLSLPIAEPPVAVNGKALDAGLDTLLDHRATTLRHPQERAIFKLQACLCQGFRNFLEANGFTEIHSPKLVSMGAESGANVFSLEYFGRQAYLAQSPQLYKQMMVGVFERVYEIAPVFRAEKHDTARHLNEYTSVDLEMGFIERFEDIMRTETALIHAVLAHVQAACGPELALLKVRMPTASPIPSLRFSEAKALTARWRGQSVAEDDWDLDPEEERSLSAWCSRETGSDFLFVTHYPSPKRPFYAMDTPSEPTITESFDLLFRGVEVTTGGQRIHDYGQQLEKLRRLGMDPAPLAGYLEAHRTGLPPHGGLGLGLERFTARLLDLDNLRRATLFPRDTSRLIP